MGRCHFPVFTRRPAQTCYIFPLLVQSLHNLRVIVSLNPILQIYAKECFPSHMFPVCLVCLCLCVRKFVKQILYLHESPDLADHGCAMCIHIGLVCGCMQCLFKYILCLHTVQKAYVYIRKYCMAVENMSVLWRNILCVIL